MSKREELIEAMDVGMPTPYQCHQARDMLEADARVPMTRNEIDEMAEDGVFLENIYGIVRTLEAHHGITGEAK